MGKKNKKEKRGKGKEKTENKTEKKAEKRSKKELSERGEEDIEKLISEFQEQDKKRVQVVEAICPPPSPRCNVTFVANPEKDELLMFGGEYFTGNKMYVYNDLFAYQIKKKDWVNIYVPNPPPPRSGHQAVSVSHQGGQMWVFGGEFSSHTQSQFHHYKDLWVLHLKDKKWEHVKSSGGPSARSGHRMVVLKKQLFVFGGFHDNSRVYKYFNDVYSFDLKTYTWAALTPSGTGPSPRSGCTFLPFTDGSKAMIYGGYSKEKSKKDSDKGLTHTDLFILALGKNRDGAVATTEQWKWQTVKTSSLRPTPRSGMAAVSGPNNKAYFFGGVFDEEDEDDCLEGVLFNELWSLDLIGMKWFPLQLRRKKPVGIEKKRRRKKEDNTEDDEVSNDESEVADDITATEEGIESLDISPQLNVTSQPASSQEDVFKVVVDDTPSYAVVPGDGSDTRMEVDMFWPSRRMNAALAVHDGTLYMYGGMYEEGDKQLTMSDFNSLDLHNLEEWDVIIAEDKSLQVWQDSDGDAEAEGAKSLKRKADPDNDASDDSSEDDSDDDEEITFDDAPTRKDGETLVDYFERSKEYWVMKAKEIYEEDGETVSERRLLRFAKEVCEEACGK